MSSEPARHPDTTTVEVFGGIQKRDLVIAEYDPNWPKVYEHHRDRIQMALGRAAVRVEHIGSTSVPGLAAKPVIDILVAVPDISAEEDYIGPLIEAGYVLRRREPSHRMLRTPELDVHVHVLASGDPAGDAYIIFRDRLRSDDADRDLYECTKRALARREWADMTSYAEAKTEVIAAIKGRARNAH